MADRDWAAHRQRMVKCKTHGLHFDPELSTGCTLCMRDAVSARPRRPPQLVVVLLCLLGISSILFHIFGPNEGDRRGPIDLGVAPTLQPGATKLDAEPYRRQLEDFEVALFRMPVEETEDLLGVGGSISATAETLSQAILVGEPTDGLQVADLIARLGQQIPRDQVMLTDVRQARSQWLRLRRERLQPAAWFLDLTDVNAPAETTVADYSDIAADLRFLIEEGAAEADSLAGTDAAEAASRWQEFARDWRQQINSLIQRLPSRPGADVDRRLLAGIQDLERAFSNARALASASTPPLGNAASADFDQAVTTALRAQQAFDDLGS